MMRVCFAFCLVFMLAACGVTAKPEYPGFKPEAYVGKKAGTKKAAPAPLPQSEGEICVGALCSCAAE